MGTHSRSTKDKGDYLSNIYAERFHKYFKSIMWLLVFLGCVLFTSALISASVTFAIPIQQTQLTPTNQTYSLIYLQFEPSGRSSILRKTAMNEMGVLAADASETTLTTKEIPNECDVLGLHASPQGDWIIEQVTCEDRSFVYLVNTASGEIYNVGADLGPDSIFLSWSSTEEIILKVNIVGNPRVYRINAASGEAILLPVPETTYDVALSPDGRRIIYSLTRGLGYGSETWIADIDRNHTKQIIAAPDYIVAFARWSSQGKNIAYIRLSDTHIPFTVGELWIVDDEGNSASLLSRSDAGHGYEPVWSPDGLRIAFVGRENEHDRIADYRAERLISNIYLADLNSKTVSAVTHFDTALCEDPVWSPDGKYLAFSSTAGGTMDVWVYDAESQKLNQVTYGANARHPTWLPIK